MKASFLSRFRVYGSATLVSLTVMVIVDYILGAEAEHLNAWVIISRLAGRTTTIGESMAIREYGLAGATVLMVFINVLFGVVLIQLFQLLNRFFNSLILSK